DTQVNYQPNLEVIEKYITSPHQVIAMEGLNHLFQHCTTGSPKEYRQIEETFAPEAIQKILDWIGGINN
nr:alpha/beta hydrolase [Bacteroidaceae bacterium]